MDTSNYTPLPPSRETSNTAYADSLNNHAPVKPSKKPLSILLGTLLGVVVLGVVVGFVNSRQTLQNRASESLVSDQACIIKGGTPTDGSQCPNGKGSIGVISSGAGSQDGGDGMPSGGSTVGSSTPRVCCPDDGGPPPPNSPTPIKVTEEPPKTTETPPTSVPPPPSETPGPPTGGACYIPQPELIIECPDGCEPQPN